MISRRLLRIKVLQILYSYFQKEERSIQVSEKELFYSINKTHELYSYLILLILDIVDYAESRIDLARQKLIPNYNDINPNTRFIDNKLIKSLRDDASLNDYIKANKISWVNYSELVRNIFRSFNRSDVYLDYMQKEKCSFIDDRKIIIDLITGEFVNNELLLHILEEKSIYWNDDIDFVLNTMVKIFHKAKLDNSGSLPPIFKNSEDKDFAKDLFRKVITNYKDNMALIDKYTSNWDIDRLAYMDNIIMHLALTEVVEFNSIPIKVSLNEYIEITKYYSTKKSNVFINGILDKIIHSLKGENKINKTGRGLIGEI